MAIGINLNDEGNTDKKVVRESRPITHLYSVEYIDPIGIEFGPTTRYYSDGTSEVVGCPGVVLRKEFQ